MKAKDLRNSILQMAVQGKLVPQDPNDEPASALLDRIRAERAKLIKEKKIKAPKGGESVIYRASDGSHYEKRGKGEPVCIDDEIPFEIPESWEWVRLESLLTSGPTNGLSPKPVDYETAVKRISLGATTGGIFDGTQFKYVDIPIAKAEQYWLNPGDLLIQRSNTRDYVGTSCVYDDVGEAFIYPDLIMRMTLVGMVMVQYADIALKSPYVRAYYSESASGSAGNMPKINQGIVCSTLMPLPPMEEQRRIIKSVEELYSLIESYDVLESARERLDAELPDRLRKSILQLAVQGKLVEQDPNDESASALLERIRTERAKLVKAGKLKAPKGGESVIYRASDGGYYEKRGKGEPVCIDDEIPFEIPESWAWARVGSLTNLINGKAFKPSEWTAEGLPIVRIQNLNTPTSPFNRYDGVVDEAFHLHGGELLFAWSGTPGTSFGAHIWYGGEALLNQHIFKVEFSEANIDKGYFRLALNQRIMELIGLAHGSAGLQHVTRGVFEATLIPIPPLSEQARIVMAASKLLDIITNL